MAFKYEDVILLANNGHEREQLQIINAELMIN